MLPVVIALILASFILDFAIPYSYYLYITHYKRNSFDPHRAINRYLSGMIGDAVCAPAINTLLFLTYYQLPIAVESRLILFSFVAGVVVTASLHLAQAKMAMTNWSMPQPWKWTFPGKYHMFSATVQFAFLAFSIFQIISNLEAILASPQRLLYLAATLFFTLIFNISFTRDTFLSKTEPAEEPS
ncbi:MAG: hypothetical protein AAB486_04205 [Patescibacteria group bacterium]